MFDNWKLNLNARIIKILCVCTLDDKNEPIIKDSYCKNFYSGTVEWKEKNILSEIT